MENSNVYGRFLQWLEKSWYGVPEPEMALAYVKKRYTPEEADFFTGFPLLPTPLDSLCEMKGMSENKFLEFLESPLERGLVYAFNKGDGSRFFALNDMFMQARTLGWPGWTDDETVGIAPLSNYYKMNGFLAPWMKTETKGLRSIPINKTIKDTRSVLAYEDLSAVLDSVDYLTVSDCACRHMANLDPALEDSGYPTKDVCFHFGKLGRYIVEHGFGREVTRHEAEEILARCEEAGLVHGVSNQQQGIDTLCNCDPQYCMWFTMYYKMGHHMSMNSSSYQAVCDHSKCMGCGFCVKRCPMDAIELRESEDAAGRSGKAAFVDVTRCIGCGVCSCKCPSGSLVLEKKEEAAEPPVTGREFVMRTLKDFRS